MSVEEKLRDLNLQLPPPPQPAGSYTRAVQSGPLIFVSGQLPLLAGQIQYAGIVGEDLDVEAGYAAAKLCALNALSILKAETGDLDAVSIVRLGGYVPRPRFYGPRQRGQWRFRSAGHSPRR